MNDENMWGDIAEPATERTPTSILREQAAILNRLTQGTLVGSVESESGGNSTLIYHFAITAPAINNHKVPIVTVQYSITIYPLTLIDRTTQVQRQCLNEDNFRSTLKGVLSSTQIRRVIAALLVQSKENQQAAAEKKT